MKVLAALAALAPLASALSGKRDVSWTINGGACKGDVVLGEFTAVSSSCSDAAPCQPFTLNTTLAIKDQCQVDVLEASGIAFGSARHVITEYFPADSDCKGDALTAIAVRSDGGCYPSSGLTRDKGGALIGSVKATIGSANNVTIEQFTDQKCAVPTTSYTIVGADGGQSCLLKFMKVQVVEPKANNNNSTGGNGAGSGSGGATVGLKPGSSRSGSGSGSNDTAIKVPPTPKPSAANALEVTALAVVAMVASAALL